MNIQEFKKKKEEKFNKILKAIGVGTFTMRIVGNFLSQSLQELYDEMEKEYKDIKEKAWMYDDLSK